MNETIDVKVRLLGSKEGDFNGNKYFTLSARLPDQTVGELTGKGDFDFAPFVDKDVVLSLEMRKNNGRFGIRAVSAKAAKAA